ncbi:hypothetical protein K431DRAFT_286930 [Polychaeton citri CBS 116435]|uniref:C2H2-type domain-containing protein n=1 Tax=Polychaeton citri CBS 116435 TaxID=1314669 RepID=A0A9P4Q716_9PEZI|nr:hypothetical protein K431DRAFT_286930 [Polychaeton citri CBS 116435]
MATLVQTSPQQPATNNATSHPFTCNTCQVAFRSSDLQRTHMQSDWHRYNLKRRVASLPPLTVEIFHEKVLANRASAAATAARASFERKCDPCGKSFYSEGAFINHLGSQKHRVLAAKQARGSDDVTETESMADSTFTLGSTADVRSTSTLTADEKSAAEGEFEEIAESVKRTALADANSNGAVQPPRPARPTPSKALHQKEHMLSPEKTEETVEADVVESGYEHKADLQKCLFCNYISPTMDLSLHHMSRQHGFFIPEKEFLVDLTGLLTYLSETIEVLHQCLFCHKAVHTSTGVQTHMRDRGHCMIAYESEEDQMEVGEFYDFRSTYSDEDEDEDDEAEDGGVSLGKKRPTTTTIQNAEGEDEEIEEEDEDWEDDDSSLSSVPTDEITSVQADPDPSKLHMHRHHSHTTTKDNRKHKGADGQYHSHAHHRPEAVYHDDYELHLPSGRTAGHRSLKTYYSQNLRNYPTPEERSKQKAIDQGRHVSDDEASDAETETDVPSQRGRGRQLISRANGGLGMVGVSDAKKREVKAVEKRDQKKAQRAENRYRAGNERRGNNQKHFRDPLLQ